MRKIVKSLLTRIQSLIFPEVGPQVIYYHDVGRSYTNMGTPLEEFEAHVYGARKNGFVFANSHMQLSKENNESKSILITFDDGFRGVWDHRDFFYEEGLCPLIFLAVDLIGKDGYLSWNEILELQEHGFMFASHTWSHRSLTEVVAIELDKELRQSRVYLSEHLGRDVVELCFPRGMFSYEILEACAVAGYQKVFTCVPGTLGNMPLRFSRLDLIPRNIVQGCSAKEFLSVVKGGLGCFRRHYFHAQYMGKQ